MKKLSVLEFNESKHKYYIDGTEIKSVSSYIKAVGLISTFYTAKSANRGTDIHKLCEWYDKGELDITKVPEEYLNYLSAYIKFITQVGSVEKIEYRAVNKKAGYAGTIDRVLYLNGKKIIVDIKTGAKAKWHEIQLGAYSGLLYEEEKTLLPVFGLYITKTGKYTLEPYDAQSGYHIFNCIKNFVDWRDG